MKIIVSDAYGQDGNRTYHLPNRVPISERELIRRIDNGQSVYFKPDGKNSVPVPLTTVKNPVTHTRYLRTVPNDKKSDNINNNIN